jgi:hypothetical protein
MKMSKRESALRASKLGTAKLIELSIERYYKNPNTCLYCKNIIMIRDGEKPSVTRKKKFCNSSCAASYNNKFSKKRNKKAEKCMFCGKDYYKKSKEQKYCSNGCYSKDIGKKIVIGWLDGTIDGGTKTDKQILKPSIRDYLLEQAGYKCSKCGWNEINLFTGKHPLQIDHIDGNSYNHLPENLRVLCPNCHSLTPFYGSLNKGRGRKNGKFKK